MFGGVLGIDCVIEVCELCATGWESNLVGDLPRRAVLFLMKPSMNDALSGQVEVLGRLAQKVLSDKSFILRQAFLSLAREWLGLLRSDGRAFDHLVLKLSTTSISDPAAPPALKLGVLAMIRATIAKCPEALTLEIGIALCDVFLQSLSSRQCKLSFEYFAILAELVVFLRPLSAAGTSAEIASLFRKILETSKQKLDAPESDHTVRSAIVLLMGTLLRHGGDCLSADGSSIFTSIVDKLKNEMTRLPAVKSLTMMLSSPLYVGSQGVIGTVLTELTPLLRKTSPALRQSVLCCLQTVADRWVQ